MAAANDDDKVVRPIRWDRLKPDEAERLIRERSGSSSNVIFTDHAFDRVELRAITEVEARTILGRGHVEGYPALCPNGRDWKVVVVRRIGTREAGVVTVIVSPPSQKLIVLTVEWMDLTR